MLLRRSIKMFIDDAVAITKENKLTSIAVNQFNETLPPTDA